MKELKAKVTNSIDILVRARYKMEDLNQPLYAVNWFATKAEWLYHFYNFLASKSVEKIGGRALFKGKVTETLLDEYNGDRDLLLLVEYPDGQQFKTLFESLYFKIVSILRVLAVKNFTFGLTHKQTFNEESKLEDKLEYALHHFKAKEVSQGLFLELNELVTDKIKIKYTGKMVAQLFTKEKDKPEEPIESIMDGIIVLESDSKEELKNLIQSQEYQKLIKQLDASYIGLLNRIL